MSCNILLRHRARAAPSTAFLLAVGASAVIDGGFSYTCRLWAIMKSLAL